MTESVTLDKLKYAVNRRISEEMLCDMDTELQIEVARGFAEDILDMVAIRHILGKQHPATIIEHPKTWWDAFKLRWYSDWMLKQWPAEVVQHKASVTELYPYMQACCPHSKAEFVLNYRQQSITQPPIGASE